MKVLASSRVFIDTAVALLHRQIFGAGGAIIQKKNIIRKKRKEKERKKGERKGKKKGENSI